MKIVDIDDQFTSNFRLLWHPRRAIILNLLDKIEKAKDIKALKFSPCTHQENMYFVYDKITKVYFEHLVATNEIKLWSFIFSPHS